MWRGTMLPRPLRPGSYVIALGTQRQRMVTYSINADVSDIGLAMINWIIELIIKNAEFAIHTTYRNCVS